MFKENGHITLRGKTYAKLRYEQNHLCNWYEMRSEPIDSDNADNAFKYYKDMNFIGNIVGVSLNFILYILRNGFSSSNQYISQFLFITISNRILVKEIGNSAVAVFDVVMNVSYIITICRGTVYLAAKMFGLNKNPEGEIDEERIESVMLDKNENNLTELIEKIEVFCEKFEASARQNYYVTMVVEEICTAIMENAFTDKHKNMYILVTIILAEELSRLYRVSKIHVHIPGYMIGKNVDKPEIISGVGNVNSDELWISLTLKQP